MGIESEVKPAAKADELAPEAPAHAPAKPLAASSAPARRPLPAKPPLPAPQPAPTAGPALVISQPPQDFARPPKGPYDGAHVEIQTLRHNPDAIRRAFETGDYPYKTKVSESAYLELMLPLQAEPSWKCAELGQG